MKVSVIVPVYNTGQALCRCVSSIREQTCADWELWLIDDGSTDNSGLLCDRLAGEDDRIHAFHQKNKGVSSARNQGIRRAEGEWITFCDADDYWERDYLEEMLRRQNSPDTLVVCGYTANYGGKDHPRLFSEEEFSELPVRDFLKINDRQLLCTPWVKLFSSEILRGENLFFDESLSLGEDLLFNLDYLKSCQKIICINRCLYHYMIGDSQSLSSRYRPDMADIQKRLISQTEELMKMWQSDSSDEYYRLLVDRLGLIMMNNIHPDSPLSHREALKRNNNILRDRRYRIAVKRVRFPGYLKLYGLTLRSGHFGLTYAYLQVVKFLKRVRRKGRYKQIQFSTT